MIAAADWPAAWPAGAGGLDGPGMYPWWTDRAGADDLARGLGAELVPGRIYAGQTGATKWPSGTVGKATLRSRISSQHIRGRIRGSTFRLTLASILVQTLALDGVASKLLEFGGEERLSQWIRAHLTVAVHPFANRDALADLEHRVLAALDPPLNLEGMPPSAIREKLTRLRAGLPL